MVDFTPGFNLAHNGIIPYPAATGTKTVLGFGSQPNALQKQAAQDAFYAKNGNFDKAPTGHVQGDSTTYAGGGSDSGPSAQDLAAYGAYQTEANNDLGRLLGSYNATKQSLNSKYDTLGNQLESGKAHTTDQYNDSVTGQNQDLLRQQNQVRQGTYQAYQNLMNLLGAYGGGGTSVAQQWAPTAAQHFQNAQLGDAGQNAASNLRSLNTTYGNYLDDYKNQKDQLFDQRNQDLANADSQYSDTKSKLDTILNHINSRALPAGDIGGALSGLDIPSINYVKPSYTGTTPVYNAPNLASFEASTPASSFASPAAVSNSSATPALAYLLSQQKRQQPALA